MSNFSLLGKQMTPSYSSTAQQQQHHGSHSNSANMNFSLGVHSQQQSHPQAFSGHSSQGGGGHSRSQLQQQASGVGGNEGGVGFLHNVGSLGGGTNGALQGFGASLPFLNPQLMQQQHHQQQASKDSQALGPEAFMGALETLRQRIGQIQAYVATLVATQQPTCPAAQQQAAAAAGALSLLTQVATNFFPQVSHAQNLNQGQGNNGSSNGMPLGAVTDVSQQQQHQLSQLFGASVAPGYNFFSPSGNSVGNNSVNALGSNPNSSPGAGNCLGNAGNFPLLQGGGGGGSLQGMGEASVNSLANQLAANQLAANQHAANQLAANQLAANQLAANQLSASQSLTMPKDSASPTRGGQGFGAGNNGGGVSSMAGGSSPAPGNVKLHASATAHNSNQLVVSNGPIRGGGMGGGTAHLNSNRSLMNSGGLPNPTPLDEHEPGGNVPRDEDDDSDEALPPGSYELVEMDSMEILAEHTHFCEICGKGFKRDANLRMHMRGHGDEYKTPAALARPDKAAHDLSVVRPRRFSCPYVGCKRNKKHRKFQPLKTMLCVKNHYRRSHCPKVLVCNKCKSKKFSVVADLKTHEKHCGCDKWQCSCGTTFSRKDKLFGHIGLFTGHTPAMPFHEMDNSSPGAMDVSDMAIASTAGNPGGMRSLANGSAGFLNGNNGMNSGSGMGLTNNNGNSSSLQGLGSGGGGGRGTGNGLSISKERGGAQEGGEPFPPSGNHLLPSSSLLQGLFPTNFLQGNSSGNSSGNSPANFLQSSSGGSSSSDGLH